MEKIKELAVGKIFRLNEDTEVTIKTSSSGTYKTLLRKDTLCIIRKKNARSAYCSTVNNHSFSNQFKGIRISVDTSVSTILGKRTDSAPSM